MSPTDADVAAAFPKRRAIKGILALVATLSVISGLPAWGFYQLGVKAGRGEMYVEGYQTGRMDREQELGKVLTALEGTIAPQVIPDDADCEILTMISARAGMLAGLKAVAYAVNLPQ
jgi:hypothetical protein